MRTTGVAISVGALVGFGALLAGLASGPADSPAVGSWGRDRASRDGASPRDVADPSSARRTVADAENGFSAFDFERSPIVWPDDYRERDSASRMADGRGFEPRLAASLLLRNTDVLRRFDASLERRDFVYPERTDPVGGHNLNWLALGKVVRVRAFAHLHDGRTGKAVHEALNLLRFGHRLERAQGSLLDWTFGSAVKRASLDCLRRIVSTADVSERQLSAAIDRLAAHPADRAGLEHALRSELRLLRRRVDEVARGVIELDDLGLVDSSELEDGADPREHFRADATRRDLARVIDTVVQDLNASPGARPRPAARSWSPRVASESDDNLAGELWCRSVGQNLCRAVEQCRIEDVHVRATIIVVALRAFHAREGRLPRELEELVPEDLQAIPEDPFDGRPMRYSPVDKIVYSVGTDRRDGRGAAGGMGARGRHDAEPTFHIEF